MARLLPLIVLLAGVLPAPGPAAPGPGEVERAEFFPRSAVRVLPGPFQEAQRRDVDYLLRLDPDRLLHSFRLNAGLTSAAEPLGGWEGPDVELRGHTLGHTLSACALMFEATGDERLAARATALVAELAKVRQALAARGANTGYLSAFPESFFDRLEARTNVWAPYYTIHKILAGLLDVERATGDAAALELASGIARWVGGRASRLSRGQWQALLETEFGGMQEALAELHVRTADPEALRLARLFDHAAVFDPLERGRDELDGLHANTQIPKAIGAALDCRLTGEGRYCSVARNFWERVARHRSYAIGGHSDYEHFSPPGQLARHRGVMTAETCNSYNMLKLTRRLFELDADATRFDFYERALYNHILASQDPATGMVSYHVALRAGAWRTYATPFDSFWCCVGTGLENPARYGEAIYARQGEALLVNLFLASELRWPEKGLLLRQQTAFPDEERTRLSLRLDRPLRLALRVRRPAWLASEPAATLNGAPIRLERRGGYDTIDREWRDGDVVELRLPMSLRAEPMADDPSVVAFFHGPIVLAADLGGAGLDERRRYGPQAPELAIEETPPVPVLLASSPRAAMARLKPTGEPLVYRSERLGRPADVELRPFFRLADRRYAVYLDVLSERAWSDRQARGAEAARAAAALDARTIDRVTPGLAEDEARHALEKKGSESKRHEGRLSRNAYWGGGEFSYLLRLPPAGGAAVHFTCWGGESRRHRFELLVDGEVIAERTLFEDRPGELFPVEVEIPERLRRGRDRVRVGFRPQPGGSIGAIFDVRVVKPPSPTLTPGS